MNIKYGVKSTFPPKEALHHLKQAAPQWELKDHIYTFIKKYKTEGSTLFFSNTATSPCPAPLAPLACPTDLQIALPDPSI